MSDPDANPKPVLKGDDPSGHIVLVDWIDSTWEPSGWNVPGRFDITRCRSVGWLLDINPDAVTIVPHHIPRVQGVFRALQSGTVVIPRKAIIRIATLAAREDDVS